MTLSKEDRELLIDWIDDAFPDERCDIEEMSDSQLLKGVNRSYCGGLRQFWQDGRPCDTIAQDTLATLA